MPARAPRRPGAPGAALALALLAAPAAAPAIELSPPEGAVETAAMEEAPGRYALPVAPLGRGTAALSEIAGRVTWRAWRLDGAERSIDGVMEPYRAALGDAGFRTLLDCRDAGCGGIDFRFEATLLPPPRMQMDAGTFAQFSARRETAAGGTEAASVLVSRVLDRIHVQAVTVAPMPATDGAAAGASGPGEAGEDGPSAEAAPPAAGVPGATPLVPPRRSLGLLERLRRDGHVAISGLDFEPGGATLSPGSAPALDMLAGLLRAEEALEVIVVGHSDNEGGLEPNLALSRRRAEAVMGALVARGVPEAQLAARGVGFLAPLTSNATASGRARNRRVELVLR